MEYLVDYQVSNYQNFSLKNSPLNLEIFLIDVY